jgi:hypothetical protein
VIYAVFFLYEEGKVKITLLMFLKKRKKMKKGNKFFTKHQHFNFNFSLLM